MSKISKKFVLMGAVFMTALFIFSGCYQPSNKHGREEQEIHVPENPAKLTLFKIDGNIQNISGKMNLGKTKKDFVTVELTAAPDGAVIICEPEIGKESKWNLTNGKNELKIVVKYDKHEKKYTASLEKISEESFTITKIKVGTIEKSGNSIFSSMSFGSIKAGIADVEIETSPADVQVSFQGGINQNEKTYKWYLVEGENILKIKISKAGESADYTVRIDSTASKTTPYCYLNGTELKEIKDGFKEKAENNENPILVIDSTALNIMLSTTSTKPGKVSINGKEFSYRKVEGSNKSILTDSVMLKSGENQIEIIAMPHPDFSLHVAGNRIRFRVKGNSQKEKIKPFLEINGDKNISKEFLRAAESNSEEPLYKVHKTPAEIKISISEYEKEFLIKEIKINGVIEKIKQDYTVTKSIEVEETSSKPVRIEFTALNEGIADSLVWTFKVQGGGEKPSVPDVRLFAINDAEITDGGLSAGFLDGVDNGKNPLYNFDGKEAKIVMDILAKDSIEKIRFKIDGTLKAELPPKVVNYKYLRTEYTFVFSDNNEHEAEIEALPTDSEKYSPRIFKFKLKSTGKIPKLPENKVMFAINELPSKSLPENVGEHLTDGTNPLYKVDGTKIKITLITGLKDFADRVKHIKFTFAENSPQTLPFNPVQIMTATVWITENFLVLPNRTDSKFLKVEVIPKDETKWTPLVYSLYLQSTGKTVKMPLTFTIDRKIKEDGTEEIINGEKTVVAVKASSDIMKKVIIGEKGKDETECAVNRIGNAWYGTREISLVENGNAVTKEIVIKVEPKDSEEYMPATCTYKLTGTKEDADITVNMFNVFGGDVKNAEIIEVENNTEKLKMENIEFEASSASFNFTKDNLKIYKDTESSEITDNIKGGGESLIAGDNKIIFVIKAYAGQYKKYKKELTIRRKVSEKILKLKSLKVANEPVTGLETNAENLPSELKQGLTQLLLKEVQAQFEGPKGEMVMPYWKNKTFSIAKKDGSDEQVLNNNTPVMLEQYIAASPDGVFQIIIDVKKSIGYSALHKVIYVKVKS